MATLLSSLKAARWSVTRLGPTGTVNFFSVTGPRLFLYFLIGVALKFEAARIFLTSSSSYLILSCSRRSFSWAFASSFWRISCSNCSLLTLLSVLARRILTASVVFLSDLTRSGKAACYAPILLGVALKQAASRWSFCSASTLSCSFACFSAPLLLVDRLSGANVVNRLGDTGFTPWN